MDMNNDIKEVLLTQEQLEEACRRLGAEITRDYADKQLMLIGVLKGSAVFLTDLMRQIKLPLTIDFMAVSSYGAGVETSGVVRILKDLEKPVAGKDILIVEDILDSGMTLSYLTNILQDRNPASIRIATLLDKPDRRKTNIKPDYSGYQIPDAFVVGYGLDYDEIYRNLPYVGILDPKVYTK